MSLRILLLLVLTGVIFGCEGLVDSEETGGGQVGSDCSLGQTCSGNLVCSGVDGTCQSTGFPGTLAQGETCNATFECQFGFACASNSTCQAEGTQGTLDQGESCAASTDCQLGLDCLDAICDGFIPNFWNGATCEQPPFPGEPFKVFFDVKQESGEFYRLPFPNDIRLVDGKINLTGHPNPGVLVEALGNPVDDYFDLLENDADGFSTMSSVYFRFTEMPQLSTVKLRETVYIIDIDPASTHYGEMNSASYSINSAAKKYICSNWLALGPSLGRPLSPATTYAAVVTTGVKNKNGTALVQDDNFAALLSAVEPADPAMLAAWHAYAPLRAFVTEQGMDSATIAAASVFTTGDPAKNIIRLRQAVNSEPLPTVTELTSAVSGQVTVYQGKVSVPFYQAGLRPFKKVIDGGGIVYGPDGLPVKVEDEAVKFSLTVPTGQAPEGGWAIVIFAHGTGGNQNGFVEKGVGAALAAQGAAVIGLEQVQHGERRGLSPEEENLEAFSPERMFYNFLNPAAARDNNVQAAADHFQLVRLIANFEALTGQSVYFDAEKIYFFGHSQGSQGPFLFAAHEPLVKGMLLSGAGGYLIESFLGKKNPVNVVSAIQVALSDPNVNSVHPLLNLLQLAFDSVDPANHARYVFKDAGADLGYPRRHVLLSYGGAADTYTPEKTQLALAKSLGVQQAVLPGQLPIDGITEIEGGLPHTRTFSYAEGVGVTGVTLKYDPAPNSDGHYVMFENPSAQIQYPQFIGTMITDQVPTIVAVP